MNISILLPNYNHEKYLEKALDAIYRQTVPAHEVIIVDDASTDESLKIIEKYQSKYGNISLIAHQKNHGPVLCLNEALKEARGEYVVFGAADDYLFPDFLEASSVLCKRYPEAGLCTSNFCYFSDTPLSKLQERWFPSMPEACYLSPAKLVQTIQRHNFWIPGNASLFKRAALIEAGGLRGDLKSLSDWFIGLIVGLRHGICYCPRSLSAFRIDMQSYSAKISASQLFTPVIAALNEASHADVRSLFVQSGVLAHLGKSFLLHLGLHPQHWDLLRPILWKKIRNRFYCNHFIRDEGYG